MNSVICVLIIFLSVVGARAGIQTIGQAPLVEAFQLLGMDESLKNHLLSREFHMAVKDWNEDHSTSSLCMFDIPRMDKPGPDGNTNDWNGRGFCVNFIGTDGQMRPPNEFDAKARLAWNTRGLLVLVTVESKSFNEETDDQNLYRKDSVEVFLATGLGESDSWQGIISPGVATNFPAPRSRVYDHRRTAALMANPITMDFARTRTPAGYALEILMPWSSLGIQPVAGREIAFQIQVNAGDSTPYQVRWYPSPGAHDNTRQMQRLRLAETPSQPVCAAMTGGYEKQKLSIKVMAPKEQEGSRVELWDGIRNPANGSLSEDAGRAVAKFNIPLPPLGQPFDRIVAKIAGEPAACLTLPDCDEWRRAQFENASLTFDQYIFRGDTFPNYVLAKSNLLRELVGQFDVKVNFYDQDGRPVQTAGKAGRYGAIVDCNSPSGWQNRRYITLFRWPDDLDLSFSNSIPDAFRAFGTDFDIIKKQYGKLTDKLSEETLDSFSHDPQSGKVFSGLFHSDVRPDSANLYRRIEQANGLWWFNLKRSLGYFRNDYLLTFPPNYDPARRELWPLIVFLHGTGGGEGELATFAKDRKDFPFIILAPRSPRESWVPAAVKAALDEVLSSHPVDRNRIYLTGLSMGGFGTWETAKEYPDIFAAIAPVCGGGDPLWAEKLKHIPTWIFHGAKDETVPLTLSETMAEALRQVGGQVTITVYPDTGHDSWTATYSNPELYKWFLTHRANDPHN